MDEIYDNLENYNEVNAVEELRSENQELKTKLEEYATSMDQLQKDFDKLSSEFKKLEYNYSSLLKTARSEIERKTQIIKNINIEKDVLICKMLQNGNESLLNYKRQVAEKTSKSVKNVESVSERKKKGEKEPSGENERINKVVDNKSDSFTSDTGQNSKNVSRSKTNYNSYNGRDSESKENKDHDDDVLNKNTKSKALSIKNRRKSMPGVSMQDVRYYSDEEYYKPTEYIAEYSINDRADRNVLDRWPDHRYYTNKILESSSIDDKTYGYKGSSRETYNSRNSRHLDKDKYRNRDKHEYPETYRRDLSPERYRRDLSHERYRRDLSPERYRRDLSPERYSRRRTKDHHTDNNQRLEYSRDRDLESPPRDKSKKSRKYRSHRPITQHNEHVRDKQQQERHSGKYKRTSDHGESFRKRKKKNDSQEDLNQYERDCVEQQTIDETYKQLDSQYTSCQSPDYVHTDTSEPVKEIMNIALTQLEDPRLTSEKYSLKTSDDKTLLSIVNNQDIDLRLIDKSTWGLEKVSIPVALLQQPTDEKVKNVCLTTDNSGSNMSPDSSEKSYQQNELIIEDSSVPKPIHQPMKSYPVTDYKKLVSQDNLENNIQQEELELKLIYDLQDPKMACDNNSDFIEKDNSQVNEKSEQYYSNCTVHETTNCEERTKISGVKSPQSNNCDKSTSFNFNGNTNKIDIIYHEPVSHVSTQFFDDKSYLSTNKGVEGDLELSDETCDTTDLHRMGADGSLNAKTPQNAYNNQESDVKCNESDTQQKTFVSKDEASKICNETDSNKLEHKNIGNVIQDKLIKDKIVTGEKLEQNDSYEKVKHKKKSHKRKDEVGTYSSEKAEKVKTRDKKRKKEKPKVEKPILQDLEKSNAEKPKLQDLLGESSGNSLITPDDLGLTTTTQPKKQSYYTSIFDDAQDTIELKETNLKAENSGCTQHIDLANNPKTDASMLPQENDIKSSRKSDEANNETVYDDVASKLSMLYANLEPLTKEADTVKTVIISTGCQLEVALEKQMENVVEPKNQNNESKILETLDNACTSTSHTKNSEPDALESNSNIPVPSFNSKDNPLHSDISSDATLNSCNITDAPDVRIFVRRKRKLLKKSL